MKEGKKLPPVGGSDRWQFLFTRDLELRGTMTADSGYRLPAQSVTTFVFHGVTPQAVENGSHPDNPSGYQTVKDFDFSVYSLSGTPEVPEIPEKASPLPYILAGAGVVLVCAVVVILILITKKKK